MSEERRRYQRVKSDFNIRIQGEPDRNDTVGAKVSISVNVSATGVLLKSDIPLPLGSIHNVQFLKPRSFDFFEGKARVVRVEVNPDNKTYEIGIEFLNLNADELKKLNFYLTD